MIMSSISSTCSAASCGSTCSQIRTTVQPSERRCSSVCLSRWALHRSFFAHQVALFAGSVACSGQTCQKQPSTKTATFGRVKSRSARRRGKSGRGESTRKRRPWACRIRRSAISGPVSRRRWRLMRRLTSGVVAGRGSGMSSCSHVSVVESMSAERHLPATLGRMDRVHSRRGTP